MNKLKETWRSGGVLVLLIIMALTAGNSPALMAQDASGEMVKAEKLVTGIKIGWGMDWLPNGDLLITEKSGQLLLIRDNEIVGNIENLPSDMTVNGQGGFLDICVHPDYEENGWIYFTYASTSGEENGSNTALMRARISDMKLTDREMLYKASPNSRRGQHYGSRIVFDNKGHVYFSVGDRGNREVNPQDISRDMGKIYRLNDDGSIPSDNPFVGKEGAKEAVFSYGHRNPQGMDIHPETGAIWANEHGPRGGDEVNIIEAGKNYGWPVISYGINYNGTEFAEDTAMAGMEQPVTYWDPSIAPAGMSFISTDTYPGWKGDLLVGSLKFSYIAYLDIENNEVVNEKKLLEGVGRIRAVEEGPDGYIYFTAEGDGLYRIVPAK